MCACRRWPPTPAAAVLSSSRMSLLKFEVSGGNGDNGDSADIARVVRGREGLPLSPPPPQRRRRRVAQTLQVVCSCRFITKPDSAGRAITGKIQTGRNNFTHLCKDVEIVIFFEHNMRKRLQMVQFECPRHLNPCVSLRLGEFNLPIFSLPLSGVIRIGLPSI